MEQEKAVETERSGCFAENEMRSTVSCRGVWIVWYRIMSHVCTYSLNYYIQEAIK